MPEEEDAVEELIDGKTDLAYTMALEIVPPITLADFKNIKLDQAGRPTSPKPRSMRASRASPSRTSPTPPKARARRRPRTTASINLYAGTINGEPFEGGTGDDAAVHDRLRTPSFPGFEDQLIGMAAGETRTLKVTFPEHYQSQQLAGKDAEFVVTAKSIEPPGTVTIDEDFAKSLGLELLAKLRDALKDRITREHTRRSRQKLKRELLDQLDKLHKFEPPPTLVEEEFKSVWKSVLQRAQDREARPSRTKAPPRRRRKAEYRAIAERRVRLGLVLAEIGEKNNITVTDEELSRAIVERARQFPGQEQRVWDYYRQNPQAVAGLRAPIFEEKVVDFLLELAKVTEKKVSREELYKDDELAA